MRNLLLTSSMSHPRRGSLTRSRWESSIVISVKVLVLQERDVSILRHRIITSLYLLFIRVSSTSSRRPFTRPIQLSHALRRRLTRPSKSCAASKKKW